MIVWATVGGTVLSVVTQIVAAKTLSKRIGRSAKNDIRKDTSGGAENELARGKSCTVGLNEFPSGGINSFSCGVWRWRYTWRRKGEESSKGENQDKGEVIRLG